MRNFSRLRFVLAGIIAVSGGVAGTMVGCSSDDSVGDTGDGGGTTDATSGGDVIVTGDSGGGDSGRDSGGDTGTADTGPKFDAGVPTLLTYSDQINSIICQHLAFCCTGTATGGDFDTAKCENVFANTPNATGLGLNRAFAPYVDGGHIQFDAQKAQKCFDDVNALGCGAVSANTLMTLQADCLAAAVGTIPADSTGCAGSAECVPPAHCEVADGGGSTGTCRAPKAQGALCDPGTFAGGKFYEAQAECGKLVTGIPRYCANQDTWVGCGPVADAGNVDCVTGTNTCQPQLALDAGCYLNVECLSNLCGASHDPATDLVGAGQCSDTADLAAPATCTFYRIVDAGQD